MSTLAPLALTDTEHAELERRVRAHTTPQRDVARARIVLLAAQGLGNRQIAQRVGMDPDRVGGWRRRFERERLAGLADRLRSGRPLVYGHDERLRLVGVAPGWWTPKMRALPSRWESDATPPTVLPAGVQG